MDDQHLIRVHDPMGMYQITAPIANVPPLHFCGGAQKPYLVELLDLDWSTKSKISEPIELNVIAAINCPLAFAPGMLPTKKV